MTWLIVRELLLKHWRAVLAFLLIAFIVGSLWRHIAKDNATELALAGAKAELAVEKAAHEALMRQLADAKTAADAAIAQKAEAEEAAQKRLAAREKYWREKYRNDPEARKWGAERVPAGVLDGLRH